MTTTLVAQEPGPIELTATQQDPYLARPEDFTVIRDAAAEPFHGQGRNDPEVAKKSNEHNNRGSVRAEGNVNKPGAPHWDISD